jgi:hypothetical protein
LAWSSVGRIGGRGKAEEGRRNIVENNSLIKYIAAKVAELLNDTGLQPGEQLMALSAAKTLVKE